MLPLIRVRFTKHWQSFGPGDVAGFIERTVKVLEEGKYAVRLEEPKFMAPPVEKEIITHQTVVSESPKVESKEPSKDDSKGAARGRWSKK
jgi:hypothetical protein